MAKIKDIKAARGAGEWTMDARKFGRMLDSLRRQFNPPKTFEEILNAEALSILQGAAKKTRRVNLNKLRARYNPDSPKFIRFVRLDGKLYPTKWKYKNATYSRIKKRLDYYKERAFSRVGLSKSIFFAIAKDSLKLPGHDRNWGDDSRYIKKGYLVQRRAGRGAAASAGRKDRKGRSTGGGHRESWHQSQRGKKEGSEEKYQIQFSLSTINTLNPYTRGVAAVQSAINGRVGLHRTGLKKGLFEDLKFITKNYPNVKLR